MGRFISRHPVGPNERFAPDAFQNQIGEEIPINLGKGNSVPGKIVAVKVADDGTYVDITFDTDQPITLDLRS